MDDKQKEKEIKMTKPFAQLRTIEVEEIKKMSIVEVLREWGHEPVRVSGNKAFYFSPLRSEKHPSFVVYLKDDAQDWFDFGSGEGGSIIDLTMKFFGIPYIEAIRMLRHRLFGR